MDTATILTILTGPAAIGIFAAIASALPAPAADAGFAYRMAYAVINAVALNVGHAKNAGVQK